MTRGDVSRATTATLVALVTIRCVSSGGEPATVSWLSDHVAAIERGRNEKKDVLILVCTDDCPACDTMLSDVFTDVRVREVVANMVLVVTKNAASLSPLALRPITAFPTILVLRESKCRFQIQGAYPPDLLSSELWELGKCADELQRASDSVGSGTGGAKAYLHRGRLRLRVGDFVGAVADAKRVYDSNCASADERAEGVVLELRTQIADEGVDPGDEEAVRNVESRFQSARSKVADTPSEAEVLLEWADVTRLLGQDEQERKLLEAVLKVRRAEAGLLQRARARLGELAGAESGQSDNE